MGAQDRHEGQEDVGDGVRVRRNGRENAPATGRALRFESREDLQRFWAKCDAREGSGVEPDWEEHKRAIEASRMKGLPDV